ncbi:MAG: hypothetical protein H6737_23580 [Alphaproteobacteria bacterium]|nr:hypothetical protein [Alphaproteobacteria bacterium]
MSRILTLLFLSFSFTPLAVAGPMCCDPSTGTCTDTDTVCLPSQIAMWCPDDQTATQKSDGEWECQESGAVPELPVAGPDLTDALLCCDGAWCEVLAGQCCDASVKHCGRTGVSPEGLAVCEDPLEGPMCCDPSTGMCSDTDSICPPNEIMVWCPDGQTAQQQNNGEWECQES